jgi:hypothetical protein
MPIKRSLIWTTVRLVFLATAVLGVLLDLPAPRTARQAGPRSILARQAPIPQGLALDRDGKLPPTRPKGRLTPAGPDAEQAVVPGFHSRRLIRLV